MHCTELNCTAPHCTDLHCTALHYCTALHCTALHCTAQPCHLHFTLGTQRRRDTTSGVGGVESPGNARQLGGQDWRLGARLAKKPRIKFSGNCCPTACPKKHKICVFIQSDRMHRGKCNDNLLQKQNININFHHFHCIGPKADSVVVMSVCLWICVCVPLRLIIDYAQIVGVLVFCCKADFITISVVDSTYRRT